MDPHQAMLDAVALAGDSMPHPNPRVGAIVFDEEGRVAGAGAHTGPGSPHAEVLALAEAGARAAGGTVVVTLEPCNHHGRTPPCTDALIEAGVARVIVGAGDPDRRVAGAGLAALRAAGIGVTEGVEAEAAEGLDPGYFHHRRTGRPLVTLKLATTLDGQVAAADGSSKWITGEAGRLDGHVLRSRSDAVMVGAGTVISDDPGLDVRLPGYAGPQPRTVIVAGRRALPEDAAVMQRDPIVCRPGADGSVDLVGVMEDLGRRGIVDLMVEGGPTLAASLLRSRLIDRVVAYLAPKLAGGVGRPAFDAVFATLGDAVAVELVDVTRVGSDLRVECRIGVE